jgi:molybdopterin molybdotransferase
MTRRSFALTSFTVILLLTGDDEPAESRERAGRNEQLGALEQELRASLGAKIDIWRVAIKPGKPFLFGQVSGCAVFGLPGNPVSAFVTFLQFVHPAILKMMGANNFDLPKTPVRLTVDLANEGDRTHYVRGRIENGTFLPIGRQESHALFGLSQSNALLRVAVGESLKAGAIVDVQTWD